MTKTQKFVTGLALAALFAAPSFAQEKAATESEPVGITVYTDAVSGYFFRGFHAGNGASAEINKDGKAVDSAFPIAPAIQPGVTVSTPIEGLWIDVWSSFVTTGRKVTDAPKEGDVNGGTATADEVDLTIGYDFSNAAGDFGFKVYQYAYPNNPPYGSDVEIAMSYTAPVLLSPKFVVSNSPTLGLFYSFGISHEFAFSESFAFAPAFMFFDNNVGAKSAVPEQSYLELDIPFTITAGSMSYRIYGKGFYNLTEDADPALQAMVGIGASLSF